MGCGKDIPRRLKWEVADEVRTSFPAHSGHPDRQICGNFRKFHTFGRISGRRANPFLRRNRPIRRIWLPLASVYVAPMGAHASLARRIYEPPEDRAIGGLGGLKGGNGIYHPRGKCAPPPDIPAPRAAFRSKNFALVMRPPPSPKRIAAFLTQFELNLAPPKCGELNGRRPFRVEKGDARIGMLSRNPPIIFLVYPRIIQMEPLGRWRLYLLSH